ncbi:MAG TPA: MGMT family protein [Iamia sp.]|nr:MGMT family protein [Iamia sp.]
MSVHAADGPEPDLTRAIEAVLRSLVPGDIVTYGEVAEEAGWPGRSRAVGRVLSTSGGSFAWWRVVNAAGRLVPGHEEEQARRLAEEGIAVDLERGRLRPAPGPSGPSATKEPT